MHRAVDTLLQVAAEHRGSTLADDALLMAAELVARLDDAPGARVLLQRLLDEHPAGDMAPQAAWTLAWMDAREGRLDGARARCTAPREVDFARQTMTTPSSVLASTSEWPSWCCRPSPRRVVRPAVAPMRKPRARASAACQMRSPTRWNPNIE